MNEFSNQNIDKIIARIPLLAEFRAVEFEIKPLSGFTNQNFRLINKYGDWILRIPKPQTNRHIDRQAEAANASIAHRLGLAPECAWRDDSGLSLTATLKNTRELSRGELQQKPMQHRLAVTLRRLHRSNCEFRGSVNLDVLLTRYYRMIPEAIQPKLADDYENAKAVLKLLELKDDMLVPSHNDLVLENLLLDDSGRIWIIDWEYASMATPYWDLATLCNAAELNYQQSLSLLNAYQGDTTEYSIDSLIHYRTVLQVLSDCWMAAFTRCAGNKISC